MKKFSVNVIAEISIFAAIGFILDLVAEMMPKPWGNGGSIGIAMVAIFIIGYRRGTIPAIICGLLIGLLDMSSQLYSISDTWYNMLLQVSLDYWIGYTLVGVGVLFFLFARKSTGFVKYSWISLGVFIGAFLKFSAHWLSGLIFFSYAAPEGTSKYWYTTTYNGGYMLPSFVLTLIIMLIIAVRYENEVLIPTDQSKLHGKLA